MSIMGSILGGAGGGGEGGSTYKVLYIVDEKAAGTPGGTATAGSWETRVLNTKKIDEIGSTLSSNEFTLPAGTYNILALVPTGAGTGGSMARLRNVTDGSTTLLGSSAWADGAFWSLGRSFIKGRFTITATKTFRIEQRVADTRAEHGHGVAANIGETETYTQVWIGQEVVGITSGEIRQLLHLVDEKATTTDGGTFTSGAWQTRVLNTEKVDEIGSTLASNQFTLPAGTYEVFARAPGFFVGTHQARLRNITDGTTTLVGSGNYTSVTTDSTVSDSVIVGRFTIAGTKTFEIQHRCEQTKTNNGFGVSGPDFGEVERYAEIWVERITTVQPAGDAGAVLYLRDERAANADSGTFTAGSWQTRPLNTEVVDEIGSTLASNQFTLPAGTYDVVAKAATWSVDAHKLRLRNITDGATALVGMTEYSRSTQEGSTTAELLGRFTITATKTFELQHRCTTTVASIGFGNADTDMGEVEVFASIRIEKVA